MNTMWRCIPAGGGIPWSVERFMEKGCPARPWHPFSCGCLSGKELSNALSVDCEESTG